MVGFSEAEAIKIISRFSQDNARTPIQWEASLNAGFSSSTPWLPVNPNYTEINVAAQENDENSLLAFYKELIKLREDPEYKETFVYGGLTPYLEKQHNLMAYLREGDKKILAAGNFQTAPQSFTLPAACQSLHLLFTESRFPRSLLFYLFSNSFSISSTRFCKIGCRS